MWNQRTYHVANAGENGAIPRVEAPPRHGWIEQAGAGDLGPTRADAGPPLRACAGETVTLDASRSSPCGPAGLLYRWQESLAVICEWSPSPFCAVVPDATRSYQLEVACPGNPTCADSDSTSVLVELRPEVVPPDLGNTLRAVRAGSDVALLWVVEPLAVTYTLHRGIAPGTWPQPPFRPGLTAAATVVTGDVAATPGLVFYRAAGASCAGNEEP